MKKKIKSLLAILIIPCISLSTFAAVVSDHDGPGFITKKEFEALKDNMNQQIDTYNQSINNKIDGAISNYLEGIDISQYPEDLYSEFINQSGEKPKFLMNLSSGSSSVTAKWNKQSKTEINAGVCNNLELTFAYMEFPGDDTSHSECSTHTCAQHLAVTCGIHSYSPSTGFNDRRISNDGYIEWTHSSSYAVTDVAPSLSYNPHGTAANNATFINRQFSATNLTQTDGSGSAWIYQILNGKKVLKYYCSEIYPQYDTLIESHCYNKFTLNQANYFNSTGKSLSPSWTIRSVNASLGQTKTAGNRKSSTSTETDSYVQIKTSLVKTTDGSNYINSLFSPTSNWTIYAYDEDYTGGSVSSTAQTVTGETLYWYDTYWTCFGGKSQKNSLTGATGKFYPLLFSPTTYHIGDFSHNLLTSLSGTDVYQGNGMPVLKANSSNTMVRIKIRFQSIGGASKSLNLKISDMPFNLGSVDTSKGATSFVDETVSTNTTKTYTVELANKDQCLWVFVKNNTDNVGIIMDSFTYETI